MDPGLSKPRETKSAEFLAIVEQDVDADVEGRVSCHDRHALLPFLIFVKNGDLFIRLTIL